MLFLLSPAKSLDYDTPVGDVPHTLPQFVPQAAELIERIKSEGDNSPADVLMTVDAGRLARAQPPPAQARVPAAARMA